MPMLADPSIKYTPYTSIDHPDRQWPSKRITKHPIWLTTDLRDGNQALPRPMNADQKRIFFRHLVKCNFKEIEVGFPSASDTEFEFIRSLIDSGEIPEDVWIQVMSPARAELIERTFAAVAGAPKVIFGLYNATAPLFRDVVFGKSKEDIIALATTHTRLVRALAEEHSAKYGARFRLAYGVEAFTQTEPEYAVEVCTAVKNAWGRAGTALEERVIFNLPATVEIAPPSHYADQIEYFCKHMENREEIIVSLHTHNDRGTAVAATEMGLMAGADRVEGCLFGGGERSGNVDLVTLALNLYSQGIPCGLDFSNIQETIDIVHQCTSLTVHPRHPYAGELVFTAFSGSHQDAIKKGMEAQAIRHAQAVAEGRPLMWEIPYLPLDPADLGRTYEAIVRVNSQSGKGGLAYIVRTHLHIDLPRPVQQEFHRVVQGQVDRTGQEMTPNDIKAAFSVHYHLDGTTPCIRLSEFDVVECEMGGHPVTTCRGRMELDGKTFILAGESPGHDPLVAFLTAVASQTGLRFTVVETHQSASLDTESRDIVSFVLLRRKSSDDIQGDQSSPDEATGWGIGVDVDKTRSLIRAAVSAINKDLVQ
ncbi:hypothetical protein C8Q77DRAFT_1158106 [Trametes polyzona]|nr:hypothetical protein C8Q77DRAFT_1158106 [Trametes polyzona]